MKSIPRANVLPTRGTSMVQAWAACVQKAGRSIAITEAATGARCTFAELDARSRHRQVVCLADATTVRGRPIVFAVPNSIAWFELFLAIVRAGGVAVPLDPSEPAAEQRRLAAAIGAALWWNGERFEALPGGHRFRDPGVAVIKLTSGSTGRPKPLVFTGDQMLADGCQIIASMGIRPDDVNYALIPAGHSYGLGNLTVPLLAHGIALVCGTAPLPHAIAADFERWRPTVFPSVPAVWRSLAAADVPPAALTSLRLAISAGAPLAPETARAFEAKFRRRIHNFYGSSETGGIAFDASGEATLAGGVGTAMSGVRLRLEKGGRLLVCSPAVVTHRNRRRNQGVGCWVPPDRVAMDRAGVLTLLGRRGTIVKIAGRRLDVSEVVARLRRLPGVTDAWVGASETAEPVLGAVVITTRPVAELRADLHATVPAWKLPKKWLAIAAWPTTDRGKVDVRALRALVFR